MSLGRCGWLIFISSNLFLRKEGLDLAGNCNWKGGCSCCYGLAVKFKVSVGDKNTAIWSLGVESPLFNFLKGVGS